jgi:hypothetical protein
MPTIIRPTPNNHDSEAATINLPDLAHLLGSAAASSHHTNTRRQLAHILFTHVWNGLAIFAILVILKHTTSKILTWKRRKAAFDPYNPPSWKHQIDPRIGAVFQPPGSVLPGQQQLHYRFAPLGAPPFWMMDTKSRGVSFSDPLDDAEQEQDTTDEKNEGGATTDNEKGKMRKKKLQIDLEPRGHFMTRPPPPPPLTPPNLSTNAFPFDTRRTFHAGPLRFPTDLDGSFIHQPNPDYMSATDSASTSSATPGTSMSPRRRSYTKTVPIGIPTPQQSNVDGMSIGSNTTSDSDLVFSPSSYPSSSPHLPPPPPGHDSREVSAGIEVQGEVVSMTDDHGAGWTRHTRVYGGGVCMACAASGGEGGFYGATVREEDTR